MRKELEKSSEKYLKEISNNIIDLFHQKKFWWCLLFLAIGIFSNTSASIYLHNKYGDHLPILNDLILNQLPYLKIAWLYDLLALIPMVLFVIYALKYRIKETTYFLFLFGCIQYLRAMFIVLTPMGSPNGTLEGLFTGSSFRDGLYPSGHTGATFLAFLLANGVFRWVFLFFALGVVISLLLGRGHYSIDIFSALIFTYAAYVFGNKYVKPKLQAK